MLCGENYASDLFGWLGCLQTAQQQYEAFMAEVNK